MFFASFSSHSDILHEFSQNCCMSTSLFVQFLEVGVYRLISHLKYSASEKAVPPSILPF